jgi:hypothetical protein
MKEASRGQGYLEADYSRGQGLIWAVVPLKKLLLLLLLLLYYFVFNFRVTISSII